MKNNPWFVRLRDTSIPQHKLRPAKWLALIALLLAQLTGNDSNLLIVFYVQIMPDDLVMQLHRF